MLAKMLRILMTQLTSHMKPKKREDLIVDATVLLRKGKKLILGGNTWTKNGRARSKGHPENYTLRHLSNLQKKTQTLLLMQINSCCLEPDIFVRSEARP